MRRSSAAGSAQDGDPQAIETAAVRLLGRREHSVAELRRKLLSKGYAPTAVEPVIAKLTGKRLVSDERFLANFVHHHARRGQGPVRIRVELRHQGIADLQIEQELERAAIDWQQLAVQVRRRKFGAAVPRSMAERAKQARFLQYRGFDADQIRAAVRGEPDTPLGAEPDDLDDSGVDPDDLRLDPDS